MALGPIPADESASVIAKSALQTSRREPQIYPLADWVVGCKGISRPESGFTGHGQGLLLARSRLCTRWSKVAPAPKQALHATVKTHF